MAFFSGTQGSDTINGTVFNDTIFGWDNKGSRLADEFFKNLDNLDRADFLNGREGADIIFGGGGNDTIVGGTDGDSLHGGSGDDRLLGDDGNDTLVGGTGVDSLSGGNGDDILQGGGGPDYLYGGVGNDTLIGSSGGDQFRFAWGGGTDIIRDFHNNDTIYFGYFLLAGGPFGIAFGNQKAWLDFTILSATVEDGDTVFRFPSGEVVIVEDVSDPHKLRDNLQIFDDIFA